MDERPNGRLSRVPPGFLNMQMILERTGITRGQFQALVNRRILKSVRRNAQGWNLFRESDVEALSLSKEPEFRNDRGRPSKMFSAAVGAATPISSEECQTVFRMLREGKDFIDIVLETGYHNTVVSTIQRDYIIYGGSIMVSKKTVEAINKLNLECEMPIESEDQILAALTFAAKEHRCVRPNCRRNRSSMCNGCVASVAQSRASKTKRMAATVSVDKPTDSEELEPTG